MGTSGKAAEKRTKEVELFVLSFNRRYGHGPTVRMISDNVGVVASVVHHHVNKLLAKQVLVGSSYKDDYRVSGSLRHRDYIAENEFAV